MKNTLLYALNTASMFLWLAAFTSNIARADDAAIAQPFIGETTILVLKVDAARLAAPEFSGNAQAAFPGGREAYIRWSQSIRQGIQGVRAATRGQTAYATIGIPSSKKEWPVFFFVRETADAPNQLVELLGSLYEVSSGTRDGLTVVLPGREVDVDARLDALVASPRAELAEAFEAVKDYPIQALLLPPDHVRRTVKELMPQLPRHLGGGPGNLLTEGLMWGALGIDLSTPRVELVIESASDEAARNLAEYLPTMLLSLAGEIPELAVRLGVELQGLHASIKPQVAGSRITIRLDNLQSMGEVWELIATAPASVAEKMRRRRTTDSLKTIIVGLHNFHDTYRQFPPHKETGDRRLSWRVHILPFIGEGELYKEFALDEPWDSPHNKRLLEKMPRVYGTQLPGIKPGHTTVLAPAGDNTIFGGQEPVRFFTITDGTSNTAALVEVQPSLAVPWTAPQDYVFEPNQPGAGLQAGLDGRALVAIADGSVNMIRADASAESLLRLFRMSDGQILDWDAIR